MPRSKSGIEVPRSAFVLCGWMMGRQPVSRESTRTRLTSLLRQYRDRLRAVKEAVAASAHAGLTRKRVQARLVTDAIPLASFADDLRRKRALRFVTRPESETESTHGMGDDGGNAADEFSRTGESQVSKQSVDYRYSGDDEVRCGQCKFFRGPSACSLVAGLIREVDVCTEFSPGRAQEAIRIFKSQARKYPDMPRTR